MHAQTKNYLHLNGEKFMVSCQTEFPNIPMMERVYDKFENLNMQTESNMRWEALLTDTRKFNCWSSETYLYVEKETG